MVRYLSIAVFLFITATPVAMANPSGCSDAYAKLARKIDARQEIAEQADSIHKILIRMAVELNPSTISSVVTTTGLISGAIFSMQAQELEILANLPTAQRVATWGRVTAATAGGARMFIAQDKFEKFKVELEAQLKMLVRKNICVKEKIQNLQAFLDRNCQ